MVVENCLNPPIRGSIDFKERNQKMKKHKVSQSPYKGFNRKKCRKTM